MHQMFLNQLNKKNLFLFSLFFISCASVKAPQGGLVDSTPPKLQSTNPKILTNLNEGQKITLSFNEYIKEESLKNSIELFPGVDEKISYEYLGKDIIITLPSNLDKDKTYVISLNSNFSDEQNVKLKENIVIPISLSNTINNGSIKGQIFGSFKRPSILLWKGVIEKEDLIQDEPDYVILSSNKFNFDYLSFDKYTVVAVDLYNPRLPLDENIVSFHSEKFIDVKEDDITKINFYFNNQNIEDEPDSLIEEETTQNFASLVGSLNGNYILPVVLELKNETNEFKTELSLDGTFSIKNIIGGNYQLIAFQDRNNNKILDTGSFNSENTSEKFYVYSDSLSLRENWELEIENWRIN